MPFWVNPDSCGLTLNPLVDDNIGAVAAMLPASAIAAIASVRPWLLTTLPPYPPPASCSEPIRVNPMDIQLYVCIYICMYVYKYLFVHTSFIGGMSRP